MLEHKTRGILQTPPQRDASVGTDQCPVCASALDGVGTRGRTFRAEPCGYALGDITIHRLMSYTCHHCGEQHDTVDEARNHSCDRDGATVVREVRDD